MKHHAVLKKPMAQATENTPKAKGPHVNLRCPKGDYYAKTTRNMLRVARLRCPVHKTILMTPAEREENRGRQLRKAA